jgi:hypothetical protein
MQSRFVFIGKKQTFRIRFHQIQVTPSPFLSLDEKKRPEERLFL